MITVKKHPRKCNSNLGMQASPQTINLSRSRACGWNLRDNKGVPIHEIFHALGMIFSYFNYFPTNELCSTCSDCVILNQYDFDQGFSHEQNRPDRNQYIDATGKGCSTNVNFKPLKESEVVDFSQTYDFCSILHYPLGEYPNICTLRLKKREQENCVVNDKSVKIGQRLGLTDTDILEINRKYNCKGEMLITTGIKLVYIKTHLNI